MRNVLTWVKRVRECIHEGCIVIDTRWQGMPTKGRLCMRCGAVSWDAKAWQPTASIASLLLAVEDYAKEVEREFLDDVGELAPEVAALLEVCRCGHDRGEHLNEGDCACEHVSRQAIATIGVTRNGAVDRPQRALREVVDPCQCAKYERPPIIEADLAYGHPLGRDVGRALLAWNKGGEK